jgi:hypothetical protein
MPEAGYTLVPVDHTPVFDDETPSGGRLPGDVLLANLATPQPPWAGPGGANFTSADLAALRDSGRAPPPQAPGQVQMAGDELDRDPVFGPLLRGETIPSGGAGQPSGAGSARPALPGGPPPGGYPYQTQVPPPPEGYQPVFNPAAAASAITRLAIAGYPTGPVEEDMKRYTGGDQLYANPQTGHSYWGPYSYGPKDPGRIQYEEAMKSSGTAGGQAPFRTVTIERTGPGGPEKVTMSEEQWARQQGLPPQPGIGTAPPASQTSGIGMPAPAAAAVPLARPVDEYTKGLMTGDATRREAINTAAEKGGDATGTLDTIRNLMARGNQTGWGGDWAADLGNFLQTRFGWSPDYIQKTFGINPNDAQAMAKNFIYLTSQGVLQLGSREAAQVFSMIKNANPSLETTPQAMGLMTNILDAGARRAQNKRGAMTDYVQQQQQNWQKTGTYQPLDKWEAGWDQAHPVTAYTRGAWAMSPYYGQNAWTGTTPDDRQLIYAHIPANRQYVDSAGNTRTKPAAAPTGPQQ